MTAPDLVLTGGPVLQPDATSQHGLAVAVTAGRIAVVGPADDVLALRAARTEVIDLGGRLLLPGFVDAHAHPFWGGLERLACDLLDTPRTVRDYQQAVASAAAARPRAPWVTGGGWSFEAFPDGVATVDMLDAVVPDRPVVLFNRDHHGVWANSRALVLAGLDADTADPPDGRIERDSRGRPSGVLHEGAAALVTDLVPAPDDATTDEALRSARDHLVPLGVTGWVEAILGEYAGQPDPLPTYLRAWASGTLDVRTTGALWWDRTRGVEQIAEVVARRDLAAPYGVALTQVKIMADGIIENQTAAMLTDYLRDGVPTGERGLSFVDRTALLEAVPALEGAGFAVHIHAIGDRAVRDALDAVAVASSQRVRAGRAVLPVPHQVAHLQVVAPDDVARFARVGVLANCQALWACHEPQMDDFTIPVLGDERSAGQYPFAAIADAGGLLALGSDWPVSSADPWQAVHVAVTRTPPEPTSVAPFLPAQALTLAQALHAGTAGSARAAGWLDAGRIVPGARADLVVASTDPFSLPSAALAEVRSDVVVVDGSVVHMH